MALQLGEHMSAWSTEKIINFILTKVTSVDSQVLEYAKQVDKILEKNKKTPRELLGQSARIRAILDYYRPKQ